MSLLNFKQQGQGKHVILIHGLFGSLENLSMVARGLEDKYLVTSVDVRNHGSSFHQSGMDYPTLANDVISLMNHLNIESAIILGHSMGGKIAMQLALENQNRVEKLIVADISPVKYPAHHQTIINGLQAVAAAAPKNRKEADSILANYVETISIRQFLLRNLSTIDGGLTFKCHINHITKDYPQITLGIDSKKQFLNETLFIKGEKSDYIQASHKEKIRQLFPNSRAKIISGAGHWLHAEKPSTFNRMVNHFIQP